MPKTTTHLPKIAKILQIVLTKLQKSSKFFFNSFEKFLQICLQTIDYVRSRYVVIQNTTVLT